MSEENKQEEVTLEGGSYEIIRNRLNASGKDLRARLGQLNDARKDVFGSIETKLLGSERVTTDNNCTPRDMVPIGDHFIFGYNVQVGLRAEIRLEDVFAVYAFENHSFKQLDLSLLNNPKFHDDFNNLYRYYKDTIFAKFAIIGPHLFMVFRVGKSISDIKTFKWLLKDGTLTYVDNRSDSDFKYPTQHDFVWRRTHRDYQRSGEHPHVSIDDRVFVETVGGDLTIKIEDNTRDGKGIYNEPVDDPDQTLDDAEFYYTIVGHLILLRIKPYREKQYRYFVYNEKIQSVTRIDAIEDTCVFLPDDHGVIFPSGYYLATGVHKLFDIDLSDMLFNQRVASPNGEDYLYIFYQRQHGHYVMLSYNLIEQAVATPIICEGYSLFENGELVYFRGEDEPQKHHTLQFWQTPYIGPDYQSEASTDSALFKIGNKDIVRAMAECHEILVLLERDEVYASLYVDIVKKASDIIDSYFWLKQDEAYQLNDVLAAIRDTAGSAIDEFDKVTRIKKANREQVEQVAEKTDELLRHIRRSRFESVQEFVQYLSQLRVITGEIISAKELRYVDLPQIEALEKSVVEQRDRLSGETVNFLLGDAALAPYEKDIEEKAQHVKDLTKVADGKKVAEELDRSGSELELLIEIVSNLKIDDPTKTTEIIDGISSIYTRLNQIKAELKNRIKELAKGEGVAEFNAQLKLLNQAMINYLDVCDSPEKCESYLTKLMVQLEELEGKFVDFDEFVLQLTEKRDEIYNAFEARKLNLIEARNKRAGALESAADRILKGIKNRIGNFKTVNEINGYFAGDLMIEKVRGIVSQLVELEDSVKADSIQSRLKTIREDAVRQLKDRQELFEGGDNVIKMGEHKFSVNVQDLALTIVARDDGQYFHLTGTNFFEKIEDPAFLATQDVWSQDYLSEDTDVYRGEYLAYQFLLDLQSRNAVHNASSLDAEQLLGEIQAFMAPRYAEGYSKGVHDQDALVLLTALIKLNSLIGLLTFPSPARALAAVFWNRFCPNDRKEVLTKTFEGLGAILSVFPDPTRSQTYINELRGLLTDFVETTELFSDIWINDAADYLFRELTSKGGPEGGFCISREAAQIKDGFQSHLRDKRATEAFKQSIDQLAEEPVSKFFLVRDWLDAFLRQEMPQHIDYRDESATLFYLDNFERGRVIDVAVAEELSGLRGDHGLIQKGAYQLHYNHFIQKLEAFEAEKVPRYRAYIELKKTLAEDFRRDLKLDEFKPRILSSFVRNQLIDKVYLPIIGDNLAKQIGVVGEKKRTDLMGMLLLISPPGYGKTTLMEYIADRLGVIFMKINGPAIGHHVTSIDPAEAPNAAAREELKKLNLAFEMGDNVMIYLDDIQHCNPEFLQKFISLCDGQRKIEGVYKGITRTYDLRGKKVAVVMAGNPYTESGDKFQIPDMLANRADTYNLGDIIGDTSDAFELSYIENSLTSNPALNTLATRSQKDIYAFVKIAQTGSREGVELEGSYSAEEVNEITGVIKKLLRVRDIILKVNLEYIASAAQQDEYRTEPPFKLQGSYRNMNKIAEKVLPIMNDEELETLLASHYENESQTLTSGAESNLLKFKTLTGHITGQEQQRWQDIKKTYTKNKTLAAAGGDAMGAAILKLDELGENIGGIRGAIEQASQSKGEIDPDAIAAIKDMLGGLNQTMASPRATDLGKETVTELRKIVAGAIKAMRKTKEGAPPVITQGGTIDADAMGAMKDMFMQAMAHKKQEGLDDETLEAMKEMIKMFRATNMNQGREERQAMLILLEKQFNVMERWLKPMQEHAVEQDTRLAGIESAIERSMSTYEWVIERLKELDQTKPPPAPKVRRNPASKG